MAPFLVLAFISLLVSSTVFSQNLVPNPGFELYLSDPDYGPTGINTAPNWFTISGTPDYFHRRYRYPSTVPLNFRGLQEPASGDGYAGIISYTGGEDRELIGVELLEPLEADKIYQLTFKVNLSGRSKYGTDDIGAVLFDGTDSLRVNSISVRNTEGNIISDTSDWITISGRYLAEGGENILGIGNFASGDGVVVNPDGDGWAYFYIDEVDLSEVCPNFILETQQVVKTICEGTKIDLVGETGADNYNWIGRHTFAKLEAREGGSYTVNSYFDCSIVQTQYDVNVEPCDCSLRVPSLINQVNNLEIYPAENVRSFEFYLVDVWGRQVYSVTSNDTSKDVSPDVSAPYFWRARFSCVTTSDQIIERTMAGKLLVQN